MPAENKTTNDEELKSSEFPSFEGLEVISRIGNGGMSTVYKASQTSLGRTVAVKVLSDQALGEAGILRFKNEARNTANLNHPNIVKVYSVGVSPAGSAYLVMEYLEGRSLTNILAEKECRYTRQQLGSILCQLLSGLDYAHKCGFLHRDIKPANIMIIDGRNGPEAKLVDFGIAKSLGQEAQKLTATGTIIGTPAYMSPEQCLDRPLDLRSDLYSMGCVIYECFSGKIPFNGNNSLELMYNHINASSPTAASMKNSCGAELAELLSLVLSKSPEDRPTSASRMRDALEKALLTLPEKVEPEKKTKEREKPNKTADKDRPVSPAEQSKSSEGSNGSNVAREGDSEPEEKQKKTLAQTAFIVVGALFLLLLVMKDSILSFTNTDSKKQAKEEQQLSTDENIGAKKEPPVLTIESPGLTPEKEPVAQQLEFAFQSYCAGLKSLPDGRKASRRFAAVVNEYIPKMPEKPAEGTLEKWSVDVIASKSCDELFKLGDSSNPIAMEQGLANWNAAVQDANTLWKKHDTKAYVGTSYGRFQCIIAQSKIANADLKNKVDEKNVQRKHFLEAQKNLLPELNAEIAIQEGLAKDSPPEAIPCLHQCLYDAYSAAGKKDDALAEMKTLLSFDESSARTPSNQSRHFANLIRKANSLPPKERFSVIDQAESIPLPSKEKEKKRIMRWNSERGVKELVSSDSITDSLELLVPIFSPEQQKAICDYNRAVAYYEMADEKRAKEFMDKAAQNEVQIWGADREFISKITTE